MKNANRKMSLGAPRASRKREGKVKGKVVPVLLTEHHAM
jgi:hypothetical protein